MCLILRQSIPNGTSHNLYSYLDGGYTVIIDFSVGGVDLVGRIIQAEL